MAMFAGDQIVDFMLRFMGSCLGCAGQYSLSCPTACQAQYFHIVGIAAWYIGRGSHQGNGYGEVAAVVRFRADILSHRN